jgi:Cu(I)/Ag(I) efflux system membrane fusion protein
MHGSGATADSTGGKGDIVFYRSPMNPSITSPTPAKDEMGMSYVPVYEGELKGQGPLVEDHASVQIDPERQQLIGLTTAKAVEGRVGGEIRTTAILAVDETRVRKVNVKVEGFVDRLFVDFTGKPVAKGQLLFSLYSPEFMSAQNEYLLAVKTRKALADGTLQQSGDDLVAASKRRLALWDVPEQALAHLEKTGVAQRDIILRSPVSGVVTAKNVVQGSRLTSADTPFEITDLSHVWALADVYETELARVKVGQPGTMTLPAFPGKTFTGRVAFVDPILDPRTRTAKVRLDLANPKGDLKPGLYGEAVLKGPAHKGILVPMDAVLDAGTQKVAFISLGNGKFQPREVTTGIRVGDQVEILSGVQAGEEVVTRANFLVDSESRLQAALADLTQKPVPATSTAAPVSGHQH